MTDACRLSCRVVSGRVVLRCFCVAVASEGISVARLWFWKGRAFDVFGTYHEQAEKWLQKAVKSEPDMIEAWNALANCFWKKKDMKQAHACLISALEKKKNKQTLCHLSMVLRALPGKDEKEHTAHITESVTRAKEALALDGKDGKSWCTFHTPHHTITRVRCSPVDPRLCFGCVQTLWAMRYYHSTSICLDRVCVDVHCECLIHCM